MRQHTSCAVSVKLTRGFQPLLQLHHMRAARQGARAFLSLPLKSAICGMQSC